MAQKLAQIMVFDQEAGRYEAGGWTIAGAASAAGTGPWENTIWLTVAGFEIELDADRVREVLAA